MRKLVQTVIVAGACVVVPFIASPGAAAAAAKQTQPEATASAPAPAPGEYKIGVVNRKKVFDSYKKQVDGLKELQQEKDKLQVEIDALSKDIEGKKEYFEKNKEKMSDEEKDKKKEEINALYTKYQSEFKIRQQAMDAKSRKFIEQMMKDIDLAVAKIGDNEKYHLILEGDPNGAAAVIWFASSIDITPQVVILLNNSK